MNHKAQDYSSLSIALGSVQALDAGGGLADKDQSHLIDISWRLTYWSISSFHADVDCMFDNQCGSGLLLLPGFSERSSFHVLFCNVPKSKDLCAKSSLDKSFLIFRTI